MKAADAVGISFPERLAKAAVRKYGKRKDHLNVDDCVKMIQRREERKNVKSAPSKRRWYFHSSNQNWYQFMYCLLFFIKAWYSLTYC